MHGMKLLEKTFNVKKPPFFPLLHWKYLMIYTTFYEGTESMKTGSVAAPPFHSQSAGSQWFLVVTAAVAVHRHKTISVCSSL